MTDGQGYPRRGMKLVATAVAVASSLILAGYSVDLMRFAMSPACDGFWLGGFTAHITVIALGVVGLSTACILSREFFYELRE